MNQAGYGDSISRTVARSKHNTGRNDKTSSLCRPAQRKVCLGYSCSLIKHLQQMGIVHGRIPFLSEFWSGQDSLPRLQSDKILSSRNVQDESIDVIPRLAQITMNHDIRQIWNRADPLLPFLSRRTIAYVNYSFPLRGRRGKKLPKIGFGIVQC